MHQYANESKIYMVVATRGTMKYALLVIDCQNDFIKGASPYSCEMLDKNLVKKIKELINLCRSKRIPIIYTQHSIKPDKSNAEFGEPPEVRACITGTPGWEIVPALQPQSGDFIIAKDKYDAFYDTDLENVLRKLKVKGLLLSGVLTNNCVRATAEGAHYRGYKIILITDCCGATSYLKDKTHEEIHDITLRDLKERMYETEITTLKDIGNIIK